MSAKRKQIEFLLAGLVDSNGDPLAGGRIFPYVAGGSVYTDIYQTGQDSSSAHTSYNDGSGNYYVPLDSEGRLKAWADPDITYKFVIKDSDNNLIDTFDYVYYNRSANLLDLTDTPSSYSGAGSNFLKVKSDTSGIEFDTVAFGDLTDTPSSMSGQSGKILAVNSGETSIEYVTKPSFVNGGEAGGANRSIGNTDAYNFAIKTNGTDRFTVYSDGDYEHNLLSGVDATMSVNQQINDNSETTLEFNTENNDDLGEYNTTTFKFNSIHGGYYMVALSVTWNGDFTDAGQTYIALKTGSSYVLFKNATTETTGGGMTISLCAPVYLSSSNDYQGVVFFNTSDGQMYIDKTSARTYLRIRKIG